LYTVWMNLIPRGGTLFIPSALKKTTTAD